jgi:hypothetical protein
MAVAALVVVAFFGACQPPGGHKNPAAAREQVATPSFSEAAGSYGAAQSIEMTCETVGATIRYTTDGSDPTEATGIVFNGAPLVLSSTTTLKAIAARDDMSPSEIAAAVYTITIAPSEVAAPQFGVAAGTYSEDQSVTITCATAGATIRFTTDGTTPSESAGTVYATPVAVSSSLVLKAIAFKSGMTASAVISASYIINRPQVSTPQFSPAGGTYTSAQSVTIATSTSDATIRYTTDGSDPTESAGTVYAGAVDVASSRTIKAVAYKTGMVTSSVTLADYVITATVTITATTQINDADKTITFAGTTTVARGSSLAVSVQQTFSSYQWFMDSVDLGLSAQAITIDTTSLPAGRHELMLVTTDAEGSIYSGSCRITVTN